MLHPAAPRSLDHDALEHASRIFVLVSAAISAISLIAAFFLQYVQQLQPCELCLWQRWPHGAVCLVALGLMWSSLSARSLLAHHWARRAVVLALVGGGAIAAMQVGIEQGWFTLDVACLGGASMRLDASSLLAQPIVRCDRVAWSFLGISLAGYNGLVSLAVALCGATRGGRVWLAQGWARIRTMCGV